MEFLSLVAGSLMLALTVLVVRGASVTSSNIILLGDLVIMANILQNCLIFAFLAIKLVIEARKISLVSNEKSAWLQLLAIFLQQAGIGFEETYIPLFYIDSNYYLKGLPVSENQGLTKDGLELESTEKVFIYKGDVIPEEPIRAENLSFDNMSQRTEMPLYRGQSEDIPTENKQKEVEEDNADKPNLFISVQNGEDVPALSHVLRAFSKDKRKVRVFNLAKKIENDDGL